MAADDQHRADDAAAEQGTLEAAGDDLADRPKTVLAEHSPNLVEAQARSGEMAGEQIEATAEHAATQQGDDQAGRAAA